MAIGNAQPGGNSAVANQTLGHRPRVAANLTNDGPPVVTVTLDAVGPAGGGGQAVASLSTSTSITWTHIVGPGPNRVLYVWVAVGHSTSDAGITSTVTFGGVAMTSLGKVHSNNGTLGYGELFRLITPAMGSGTVLVSTAGTVPTTIVGGSASYFNTDQSSPETVTTAFGTGTTATVANSGTPGDQSVVMVVGGSVWNSTPTTGTVLWLNNRSNTSGAGEAAMAHQPSDRGLTQSWAMGFSDDWAIFGADVHATSAADATYTIDTPIWVGDYEPGDFRQFTGDPTSYRPNSPSIITASPKQGTYAGRYTIPAGTNVAGAGVDPRCEDTWNVADIQEGDDRWFGGWVRLDSTFVDPAPGEFCVITQWKNDSTGSPPLELTINNDTSPAHWRIEGGFGYPGGSQAWVALDDTANTLSRGTWVRWDFHIVFSSNPAIATFDAWKDGVQVVTAWTSPTLAGTMYPSQTTYWKRGIYRSITKTTQDIIDHDGWLAGRTATSVNFPASTTVSATVAMSGSGTMSAVGAQQISASPTMAGAGSMGATGNQTVSGSAAMSGTGTLSATGTQAIGPTVTMPGAGTMTAAGAQTTLGTIAMSGVGALTAPGSLTSTASVGITAAGTLSASGLAAATVSAVMSGAGSVSANGAVTKSTSAAMTAAGTMSVSGVQSTSASAAMAGAGLMSATPGASAVVTMTGAGSMAATGIQTVAAVIAMTGSGSMAASAAGVTGSAAMTGAGTMTTAPTVTKPAAIAMAGVGAVGVTPAVSRLAAAAMVGAGSLAVVVGGSASAAAAMTGTGTLATAGSDSTSGAGTMTGAGTLGITPTVGRTAVILITGSSGMTAAGRQNATAALAFVGAGTLAAAGVQQALASLAMIGTGTLGSGATVNGSALDIEFAALLASQAHTFAASLNSHAARLTAALPQQPAPITATLEAQK